MLALSAAPVPPGNPSPSLTKCHDCGSGVVYVTALLAAGGGRRAYCQEHAEDLDARGMLAEGRSIRL
jgi:hypothetical protein